MITQIYYNYYWGDRFMWSTTASDPRYNTFSRVHIYTKLKPTKRMIRALQKKSNKQTAAYHANRREMNQGTPSMLVQMHEQHDG